MRKHIHHIIFFTVSLLLICIWFRNGNTLGAGETGNPFYNLKQMFAISGYAWGNQVAGGNASIAVTSGLFWGTLYVLNSFGVPGFMLQASFFFICLYMGMFGMYLLTKELFPKLSSFCFIISSLFYTFNLFSLMNIWNRFLTNTILFYSFIPFALWIIISGFKRRRYFNALILSLLCALLSYAFAAPAQTLIFWGLFFFTTCFYILVIERSLFPFKFFIASALSWVAFNFWWIFQQMSFRFSSTYVTATSQFFSPVDNFRALVSLSNTLGQLNNLLLMHHGTFFIKSTDLPYSWPLFYTKTLPLILQWLIVLLVIFISIRNIKNKWVFYLFSLFMFGIFISKGIASPFGELFSYLFQEFSIISFFRNPFEKLGVFLPLAFSPLFAFTIYKLKWRLIKVFSFLYVIGFLGWPFWTGLVFSSGNPPANNPSVNYEVVVPDYYKEANDWLNSQPGEFRFITFPIGGEGIFHTWEKGYAGIEQSGLLFEKANISYNTTIPYFHDAILGLEESLLKHDDFYKAASLFNVKYFVVRDDVNYQRSGLRNPQTIKNRFQELASNPSSNIEFVTSFGKLDIYKISDEYFVPKIYASQSELAGSHLTSVRDIFFSNYAPRDVFIDNITLEKVSAPTKATILHPKSIYGQHLLIERLSQDSNVFPHVTTLPTSNKYYPILWKENLLYSLNLDPERRAELAITLLGKRLKEIELAVEIEDEESARKSISIYKKALPGLITLIESLPREKVSQEKVWRQSFITDVFMSHLSLLSSVEDKATLEVKSEIEDLRDIIFSQANKMTLFPENQPIVNVSFPLDNRFVFQFEVFDGGRYEFIIDEKEWELYYDLPETIQVQIDSSLETRRLFVNQDGYASLGIFNLSEGIHEIGFNAPQSKNLLNPQVPLVVSSYGDVMHLQIENFDPFSTYNYNLEYQINKGVGFQLALSQNTDYVWKDEVRYSYSKIFLTDKYLYDHRAVADSFPANSSADDGSILFSSSHWNNCEEIIYYNISKCKDELFRAKYDRESNTTIEEITVAKNLRQALLRKTDDSVKKSIEPKIDFKKISQTKYEVNVENVSEPFVLVFSELFDPGWRLYNDSKVNNKHIIANGYANAWLVEDLDNSKHIIEFMPQRNLQLGVYVSIFSIVLGIAIAVYIYRNEKKNI